jgi:AGCS family alanine or glycine:cation symporter
MTLIQSINSFVNGLVWGPPMLILLVGTGVFLTFMLKFPQVSKIGLWWKHTFGGLFSGRSRASDGSNITPFQAVSTAMASTVGTGNIVGVATAVTLGGPGAVFWMWVSGFFGMVTKYAEVVLALKYREKDEKGQYHGGPMYYIRNGLGAKWLAVIFAALGALATFGIGNMTQANAIASSLNETFGIPAIATGLVLAGVCAIVIIGGIKRIASVTEKLVPFMAAFYLIGGVIILFMNAQALPETFILIMSGAFSFESVGGGIMGYVIMRGMRYGVARGVFSNEAGLGSAPIAHAASSAKEPVEQGLWGIFEVFVDTILICTLTGLVVISSGLYGGELEGAPLVLASFNQAFGSLGGIFVSVAIFCFASSTILGWSYYGQQCLGYLTNNNRAVDLCYKVLFSVLCVVGAVGGLTLVWDIADTLNGLMAIPNLIALLLLYKVVTTATKEYLKKRKTPEHSR